MCFKHVLSILVSVWDLNPIDLDSLMSSLSQDYLQLRRVKANERRQLTHA